MKIYELVTSRAGEYLKTPGITGFSPDYATENEVINVYKTARAQKWLGFGGAFTETSAYNYAQMKPSVRKNVIKAYFSREGLGYKFCRMHIGSCDFGLEDYAYTEPDDRGLSTFDLGRDRKYVIPFVSDALKASRTMAIFASPWSPPYWMKDTGKAYGGGKLLPEWSDVYAEYICRYIEEYKKLGIDISAVTPQNEPNATQTWDSCVYTAQDEARFIKEHLAPAFDRHGLGTKIIIWDHNKERVFERASETLADKEVRRRVFGIGFHWYSGGHFDAVAQTKKKFPGKQLIETEFCCGMPMRDEYMMSYAYEIIRNINSGMSASVDWNMIVDGNGGPYHLRDGGCTAPIIFDGESGKISLSPIYYGIYHFAHYIPRGSVRLGTSSFDDSVIATAFERRDGKIAVVIVNRANETKKAKLRAGDFTAPVTLEAQSVTTAVIGD